MIHGVSPSFGAGRPGSQCNAPLSCSPPPSAVPMLEPEADAGDEAGGMDVLAGKPRQPRRVAGCAQIRDIDIGCELAAELIAQALAELYVDQPRAEVVLRNILRGEIDLGARLQDQALGNALVVIALDPAQNIARGREEQRAFDFEQDRKSTRLNSSH